MSRNILYVGDQLPVISAVILDASGAAVNLTGYTVKFAMRQQYAASNTFGPNAATITDAVNGLVSYTLGSSDLAGTTPGIYVGQWEVVNGTITLHVDAGQFEVRTGL